MKKRSLRDVKFEIVVAMLNDDPRLYDRVKAYMK